MGYFSNGMEGRQYQHRWCSQCQNDDPDNEVYCPVWNAHLLYNGNEALNEFIPYVDGVNGKCRMYTPVDKPEPLIKLANHVDEGRLVF